MPTDRQIAANRANALKSTGPRTPEGKRNSSRNATRHGILARTVVLDTEGERRFRNLLFRIEQDFAPETECERHLIEMIAVIHWRQMRVWAVEKSAFDRDIKKCLAATAAEPRGMLDPTVAAAMSFDAAPVHGSVDRITRYESRISRQYARALSQFLLLRREREARAEALQAQIEESFRETNERSHQPHENKELDLV